MERGLNRHVLRYADPGHLDRTAEDMNPDLDDDQLNVFVAKLVGFGLMEHEITVLVEHFIFKRTYASIAKEYGFICPVTVHRIYKKAMQKAEKLYQKERGL